MTTGRAMPAATAVNQHADNGQKRSAVDFWNEYHEESGATGEPKEWIARNTPHLLDLISSLVEREEGGCHHHRRRARTNRILEIGCGTSTLSRSLLSHLRRRREEQPLPALSSSSSFYDVVATDVSDVCIQSNRHRDGAFTASLAGDSADDTLRYEVLDALSTADVDAKFRSEESRYDVVLDKGCLDTFLFRNSRGKKSTERHPPLLATLLLNVSKMLQPGGRYIVISPRRRIPPLAQFLGFSEVTRLDIEAASVGELDGNQGDNPSARAYAFVCQSAENNISNDTLSQGETTSLFRDTLDLERVTDESMCEGCLLTFEQFRKGESLSGRGKIRWLRKWKGHQQHCNKKT